MDLLAISSFLSSTLQEFSLSLKLSCTARRICPIESRMRLRIQRVIRMPKDPAAIRARSRAVSRRHQYQARHQEPASVNGQTRVNMLRSLVRRSLYVNWSAIRFGIMACCSELSSMPVFLLRRRMPRTLYLSVRSAGRVGVIGGASVL